MSALPCKYSGYVVSQASGGGARGSCEVAVVICESEMARQEHLGRVLRMVDQGWQPQEICTSRQLVAILPTLVSALISSSRIRVLTVTSRPV
jgi:hypothetical protein